MLQNITFVCKCPKKAVILHRKLTIFVKFNILHYDPFLYWFYDPGRIDQS